VSTRLNISVPDDLAERARALSLPISYICQKALRKAVKKAAINGDCPTCGRSNK